MDNKELVQKLRDLARGKGTSIYKRTIFKMAAQKIEQMESQMMALACYLEDAQMRYASAVADLKDADIDCVKCLHKTPPAPCNSDENEVYCDDCPYECVCKDCIDNSKWEYAPGTAGVGTHGDWIRSKIASDNALADELIRMFRTDAGQDLSYLWCDNEGGCKNHPEGECCDAYLKGCVLCYLRQPCSEPNEERL